MIPSWCVAKTDLLKSDWTEDLERGKKVTGDESLIRLIILVLYFSFIRNGSRWREGGGWEKIINIFIGDRKRRKSAVSSSVCVQNNQFLHQ